VINPARANMKKRGFTPLEVKKNINYITFIESNARRWIQ